MNKRERETLEKIAAEAPKRIAEQIRALLARKQRGPKKGAIQARTQEIAAEVRKRIKAGESILGVANDLGIGRGTVRRIMASDE